MELAYLLGIFIIYLFIMFDKNSMRIKPINVGKFLAFMGVLTILRLILFTLGPEFDHKGLDIIHFSDLVMVFWEDAVFAMVPLAVRKWIPETGKMLYVNRIIWATLLAVLSVIFMLAHLYQGPVGYITIIYPYFISYRYGIKYGFGTVMICHILYDVITLATIRFYPNIINILSNL